MVLSIEDIEENRDLRNKLVSKDPEAWGRCYSMCRKAILKITQDPQTIDDHIQNALLSTYEALDKYDPEDSRFITWVFHVAMRRTTDTLRENNAMSRGGHLRIVSYEEGKNKGPEESVPHQTETAEKRPALRKLIDSLTPIKRELIIMHYSLEHPYSQISDILKMPLGTVKSSISRALGKLEERAQQPQYSALT